MKSLPIFALSVLCGLVNAAVISGKVTDAATGKGLPGLPVSDGFSIVRTDDGGNYRITVPDSPKGAKIYVHQPSDYRAEEFYRIVPQNEQTADFAFHKVTPTQGVTFLQVADTETYSFGWAPAMIAIIQKEKPDFFLHSGDFARIPGIIGHKAAFPQSKTGVPIHVSVGNHDLCKPDEKGQTYYDLWFPYWYSFEMGGVLFIVGPIRKGDSIKVPYDLNQFYEWFGKLMACFPKNQPKILLAHDLPQGGPAKIMLGKFDPLDYNCRSCFFGHWHENFVSRHQGGFTGYCVSPITKGEVDAQAAYRMVTVAPDGKISTRLVDVFALPAPAPKALSPELERAAWHLKLVSGSRFVAPKQQGKCIWFAEEDNAEAKKCAVVCVDTETGKLLWRKATDFSVMGEMALNKGILYAMDTAGGMYAFQAATGKILWKKKAPFGARAISSGLVCENGVLYGNDETSVAAWRAKDGSRLWRTRAVAGSWSGIMTAPLLLNGKVVICGRQWSGLMAMDAKTGKALWHRGGSKDNAEKRMWFQGATPVLSAGKIYLKNSEVLAEVDPETGNILRETPPKNAFLSSGKVVVTDDLIFAGTRNHGVTAWKQSDFSPAWSFTSTRSRTVKSELLLWDPELLIVPFLDGSIHFLSPATGKAVRPPLFLNSPAQVLKGKDNTLLILTLAGDLYALPQSVWKK